MFKASILDHISHIKQILRKLGEHDSAIDCLKCLFESYFLSIDQLELVNA